MHSLSPAAPAAYRSFSAPDLGAGFGQQPSYGGGSFTLALGGSGRFGGARPARFGGGGGGGGGGLSGAGSLLGGAGSGFGAGGLAREQPSRVRKATKTFDADDFDF